MFIVAFYVANHVDGTWIPRSSAVDRAPLRIAAVKALEYSEMKATLLARFMTERETKLLSGVQTSQDS